MALNRDRKTIYEYAEFPTINGIKMCAVWAKERAFPECCEESGYTEDGYYAKGVDHYSFSPKFYSDGGIRTKEIPKQFAELMGKQIINERKVFITHITIRDSGSGHASADEAISVGGLECNGTSASYGLYLGWDIEPKEKGAYSISRSSEYGKKLMALMKTKHTVEVLPDYYALEYPCSYIRREGGLNYPDVKIPSWRWLHGSPYVSNDYSNNYYHHKNIRVYDKYLHAHLYLERVEKLEKGDDNLVEVSFPRDYDKKPDQFCYIGRWSESKKEAPHQLIRWRVAKIDKDHNWPYHMEAMLNDKVQFKRQTQATYFRVQRMVFLDGEAEKD